MQGRHRRAGSSQDSGRRRAAGTPLLQAIQKVSTGSGVAWRALQSRLFLQNRGIRLADVSRNERHGQPSNERTTEATPVLTPLPPSQAWELGVRSGDPAAALVSPARRLLLADDGTSPELLARWPLVLHRAGYRMPLEPTCLAELAAGEDVTVAAMACVLIDLEDAECLVWLGEHHLYAMNLFLWGKFKTARDFSALLWKIGHVPRPERLPRQWEVEIDVARREATVSRDFAEDDEKDSLLALDTPSPAEVEAKLARRGLFRVGAAWETHGSTPEQMTHTARFAEQGGEPGSERYEPALATAVFPWDEEWQRIAHIKGWIRSADDEFEPPNGLW